MAAQSLLLFGGKVSTKQRNTVPGKDSVISLHDKQWQSESVAAYDRISGPDRRIYAGVLRRPVASLRFCSAVAARCTYICSPLRNDGATARVCAPKPGDRLLHYSGASGKWMAIIEGN